MKVFSALAILLCLAVFAASQRLTATSLDSQLAAPSVTLTVNGQSSINIGQGEKFTLAWGSAHTVGCTLLWASTPPGIAQSGSVHIPANTSGGSTGSFIGSYTFTCIGEDGSSVTKVATISTSSIPPSVTLTVNNQASTTIDRNSGEKFTLAWGSTHTTRCTLSWTPAQGEATQAGSVAVPPNTSGGSTGSFIGSYTFTCVGENGSSIAKTATVKTAKITSGCDEGWIRVPGNPSLGTKDFCVMKFEAQNPLGSLQQFAVMTGGTPRTPWVVPAFATEQSPVSRFSTNVATSGDAFPWTYITQVQAKDACARIGASLMDIPHAQTINRDLMLQPVNWQSGIVGRSCLFGGHLDLQPNAVVAAPHGTQATADPYEFMNEDPTLIADKVPMCPFVTIQYNTAGQLISGQDGYASRRTMQLSNGETIWDWSGNASEWLANTCSNNGNPAGSDALFLEPNGNGYGWWDYRAADHPASTEPVVAGIPLYTEWTQRYLQDFEALILGPYIPSLPGSQFLNSNNGTGKYFGCETNGSAMYRGGAAYHGVEGGIFQLHSAHETIFNHPFIGFRCVKDVSN